MLENKDMDKMGEFEWEKGRSSWTKGVGPGLDQEEERHEEGGRFTFSKLEISLNSGSTTWLR